MYGVLIKLIVGISLLQLGLSAADFFKSGSKESAAKIEAAKKHVLRINWKPITVFPEEAQKLR